MSAIKKNLLCAFLVTLGLILGYLEQTFLPLPFYGLKIGLSNLPVIFVLYYLGIGYAYTTGILKAILSGLLFSGVMSIFYSFFGIIFAVSGMGFVKKSGKCSAIGVSVAGSSLFQVGQVAVACIILSSKAPLYYLAYLLIGSVFCGVISGILIKWLGCRLRLFKENIQCKSAL